MNHSSHDSSNSSSDMGMYFFIALGLAMAAVGWFRHGGLLRLGQRLWQGMVHLPWWIDALVFLGLVGLPTAWAWTRLSGRRQRGRAMTHLHIQQGPDDVADPVQVTGLWDSVADALRPRYLGWLWGTPAVTFSLERMAATQPMTIALTLPTRWVETVTGIMQSTYPHVRVVPTDRCAPTAAMSHSTQLSLRSGWDLPLRSQRDYTVHAMESVISAWDRTPGVGIWQAVLVPWPPRPIKKVIRRREAYANARDWGTTGTGAAGTAAAKEAAAAIEAAGHGWFRVELRMATSSRELAQAAVGGIAQAAGQNAFRAHTVWLFKGLWRRWFAAYLPSVGLFGWMILSAISLASVLALPSGRLRTASLNRHPVRRQPVPVTLPDAPPTDALVTGADEPDRRIGIAESDRRYNILAIGTQGSGKSTILQRAFLADIQRPDKMVVLIDTKGDLAHWALGACPPNRRVTYFAPGDPDNCWGLNPLADPGTADLIALDLVDTFRQIFGAEAVGNKSAEYFSNAILAALHRPTGTPTLMDVYRILTDSEARDAAIDGIQDPFVKAYWTQTFAQQQTADPRFTASSLSPILNKLNQFLSIRAIRRTIAERPQVLQLDTVIAQKGVLIADLSKHTVTEAGANLLAALLVASLWHAILHQGQQSLGERVPVSIIADEAANYLTPSYQRLLAEGRAFGAQSTVALQFLKQIPDPALREALWDLCQQNFLFQTRDPEDADRFAKASMRTFLNQFNREQTNQAVYLFDPRDFAQLPIHHCVAALKQDGIPQPPFLAKTIAEDGYRAEWAYHHRGRNTMTDAEKAVTATKEVEF